MSCCTPGDAYGTPIAELSLLLWDKDDYTTMRLSNSPLTVTRSITIARSPHDVFRTMTDPKLISQWLSSVFDADTTTGAPVVEGSEVWCSVKLHGHRMRVEGTWTTYTPPYHGTFSTGISPIKARMLIDCAAVPGGTLAQITIEIGNGHFFGLVPSFAVRQIGRMLEFDLGTLKTIMEPPASAIR